MIQDSQPASYQYRCPLCGESLSFTTLGCICENNHCEAFVTIEEIFKSLEVK